MINQEFIPVSLDGATERRRKDKTGQFIRESRCVVTESTGAVHIVTASGKSLGAAGTPTVRSPIAKTLNRALAAWKKLPPTERQAGAVKVGKHGPIDSSLAPPQPPRSCLILRVWNRQLGFDDQGELRYTVPGDFIERRRHDAARFKEPGNDFMWIPENEWQALIPEDPQVGDTVPIPKSLSLRIMRYHLDPARGFTQGLTFRGADAKDGRLTATVQDVTPRSLALKIEGSARLKSSGKGEPSVYQPAIPGYLEYDRGKKTVTRFDLLALGTASGAPRDANEVVTPRRGPYPLGIAFELVRDPTPAQRLRPRGARWSGNRTAPESFSIYWSTKR